MNSQGYAVVDFETTGLSPAKGDRAIEIGLVHVAPDGTLEDEHETLIHVDRSVGASLEADPKWPGFQRRLDAAGAAAEQWPTFATLPKKEWLPRGTHLA